MDISIEDIDFGYSSEPVLNDVCLRMDGPQFVSIIGPNGVGKSTLIHCINKIISPTKGAVLINGRDVSQVSLKEMAKDIGYVPYSSSDSFPLSVADTIMMGRYPHSKWGSREDDLKAVYDVMELLGIEHLALRSFDELSAGQHQKVMLARGLVQDPHILLLDEPTSNLDIRHQVEVTKVLRDLSRQKSMIVIMICHDLNIAAKYSDNVILMYKGSIYAVGAPSEVITEESIRTVYGVETQILDVDGRPHMIISDTSEIPESDEWKSPYIQSTPVLTR